MERLSLEDLFKKLWDKGYYTFEMHYSEDMVHISITNGGGIVSFGRDLREALEKAIKALDIK